MNWIKCNLLRASLTVLLAAVASSTYSYEFSKTYSTSFNKDEQTAIIYKLTDFNGKITYSTSISDDFIQVEEVAISSPPPGRVVKETKDRIDKLRITADQLVEAREKREAIREEEEKKRLEKLALLNQLKPPPVIERNVYVVNPRRLLHPHHHGVRFNSRNPVQPEVNKRHLTHITLPPSTFPPLTIR